MKIGLLFCTFVLCFFACTVVSKLSAKVWKYACFHLFDLSELFSAFVFKLTGHAHIFLCCVFLPLELVFLQSLGLRLTFSSCRLLEGKSQYKFDPLEAPQNCY